MTKEHDGGGVKIPDQNLSTLEWHTSQVTPVTTMTDRTLPLSLF
jgi:hypothetical protein